MNYRVLPQTNLRVAEICLGSGDFGGQLDRTNSFALLDQYTEMGGNFIDTAHVYNNWIPGERSRSEKMIGAWMRQRRNREDLVVATKGGHPDLRHMNVPRLSSQEIIEDLEESLIYLQTDVIDLYWLHRDDPARPVERIVDVLAAQAKAGKIRYYGASNWKVERLSAAQAYAAQSGLPPFAADQVLWNAAVVSRSAIPDQTIHVMDGGLKEYHLKTGLAAIPYSSQANGLFTKLDKGVLGAAVSGALSQYPLKPNLTRLEQLRAVCRENGISLSQAVLAYLLSQPFTTIPIIGPKTTTQLEDSLRASGVRLSPEQLAMLG